MPDDTHAQLPARRYLYEGRVQGVGFRYTAASIARRYAVSGFVRNLRNGAVELVVAGPTTDVESFLAEVADVFRGNITSCTVDEWGAAEQFSRFEIRR